MAVADDSASVRAGSRGSAVARGIRSRGSQRVARRAGRESAPTHSRGLNIPLHDAALHHGRRIARSGLTAILEGIPAGLALSRDRIDADLARRQQGYGRGGRMRIEKDRARIVGGVRFGRTLGSPIAVLVPNIDYENWRAAMAVWGERAAAGTWPGASGARGPARGPRGRAQVRHPRRARRPRAGERA
jgi:hypothetical protein